MKYGQWNQIAEVLQTKLNKEVIEHWFDSIIDVERQDSKIFLTVFSHLQAEWMDSEYSYIINETIKSQTGEDLTIAYIVTDPSEENSPYEYQGEHNASAPASSNYGTPPPSTQALNSMRFNPRYTFETFVVGSSNRFAHAAALAVADRPAQSYNPLFLYGNSGLGKTHLMHAIGHRVKELRPNTNVVYISTEAFTNDFISSVRKNEAHKFKNRYRNADIFLVDDIQFLTGKEGTQEEFFHTFNALHEQGKQIVISSDRHPKNIATLEDRLRNRFEGGLITDIQPPDLETRIAILQHKAEQDQIKIMDEALYYIADNISSNIRELEGALNRVSYYANLADLPLIGLNVTQEALRGMFPENNKPAISFDTIKETVANYYQIKISDLSSPRRDRVVSRPRHIAMYLCRELLDASLPRIGEEFGGRDHSTVIHGCEKVQKELTTDYTLNQTVTFLINQIKK